MPNGLTLITMQIRFLRSEAKREEKIRQKKKSENACAEIRTADLLARFRALSSKELLRRTPFVERVYYVKDHFGLKLHQHL